MAAALSDPAARTAPPGSVGSDHRPLRRSDYPSERRARPPDGGPLSSGRERDQQRHRAGRARLRAGCRGAADPRSNEYRAGARCRSGGEAAHHQRRRGGAIESRGRCGCRGYRGQRFRAGRIDVPGQSQQGRAVITSDISTGAANESGYTGAGISAAGTAPDPAAAGSGGVGRRPVYIIDGSRTPFIKARGKPGPFTPVDLAVQCGRPLLLRQPFAPDAFDQVILGCVNVIADEMNPARVAALRLGMGEEMVAFTVQINCGSGMQSIDTGYRYIREGVSDLILAGGAEALSYAPLVWPQQGVRWFAGLAGAKGIVAKLAALAKARPADFKPVIGLERGLTDPITELNMGQTAEVVGHLFGVTREQSDAYAVESHKRLANAQAQGWLKGEVETSFARDGKFYDHDDGVRPDSTIEKLAGLKPVFERPWGQVTAGNSSQITDGASWTILASEDAVAKHGLSPKAVIIDSQWSALDPSIMGLGPVLSATGLLKRNKMTLGDVETWELNEAFATQVLGCLAAWNDDKFCREILGLEGAAGQIDHAKLNVDGGAISLGHPVGCSGNRIVLHLVNAMKRLGTKRGIATECIGGGRGGALVIETE